MKSGAARYAPPRMGTKLDDGDVPPPGVATRTVRLTDAEPVPAALHDAEGAPSARSTEGDELTLQVAAPGARRVPVELPDRIGLRETDRRQARHGGGGRLGLRLAEVVDDAESENDECDGDEDESHGHTPKKLE